MPLNIENWKNAPLGGLTACRNLLELPVLSALGRMFRDLRRERPGWTGHYCQAFYALTSEGYDDLGRYLEDHIRYDESPVALSAAKGTLSPVIAAAAQRDVGLLNDLLALPWDELCREGGLPRWTCSPLPCFDVFQHFYEENGCGQFARYRAFVWQDETLIPVEQPDCIPAEEMLGYQRQRDQVAANTRALLSGRRVNNMLLYGASGTGKSATVKALLGMEGMENLRLIEVDKTDLGGISQLVRLLGHQPQKFILFIDDLAFDKDDHNYSVLKTILEGGVEPRPDNVAVYATTNRRHLVRETFSDRLGDEVDASETIQEKTSLSERFGLRVLFQELTKAQFLNLIRQLATLRGVAMEEEQLMALAVRWDIRNPNRTPRSAVQFIDSLATL
ncbi:MAG: ATP-binding protein [Clostridiales bacterium]|nr:ATP-binding protein [Clostridiales bacterium]